MTLCLTRRVFYSEGFVRRLIGGDEVSQKASLNEFKSKRLIPGLQSEARMHLFRDSSLIPLIFLFDFDSTF